MKQIKYTFIIIIGMLCLLLPAFVIIGAILFIKNPINYLSQIVLVTLCAFAISFFTYNPLRALRVKFRRAVEYDEYGRSKSKGHYDYLSKKERDIIDLQKTADMERLVNSVAIKKMMQQGPKKPMEELDAMIGLDPVKMTVKEMVARMKFEKEEKKQKKNANALSGRHMVFFGSPGTGKTTVARILTGFLYQYGYIKENKCIEIDGNFLKAGTESAIKTEMILRYAYGGVLFIDEAYALMDSSDNSGEQVIATLIKQMEDQRGKFILILAGYSKEMKKLIELNPGFESRIKEYLYFPDYSASEMREILKYMAKQNNFEVDELAYREYDKVVEKERKLKSFGNGRTVRNILDKAIDKHTYNLASGIHTQEDRYVLKQQDFVNLKIGGFSELL